MKKYMDRKFVIDRKKITIRKEHLQHLGHQLSELEGFVYAKTMQRLQVYEAFTLQNYNLGALDTLFLLHWYNMGLNDLGKRNRIQGDTLYAIFDRIGLPRLSGCHIDCCVTRYR